jgi:hypothetical protein
MRDEAMSISPSHPLRQLFQGLVQRRLYGDAQIHDSETAAYVSNLLVEFTHANNLYKVRSARGKRLEEVGEMLLASNPLFEGRSFDYERAVRKHIGDYTLFLAGLFPEYVASLPRRGLRLDAFVDYVKAGKESYHIVSTFDLFEYQREAPLFRRLANSFELCVFGLNLVKRDLEEFQESYYQGLRAILG